MQQQTLCLPAPRTWGGRRVGAGRKPKNGFRAGVAHAARERLSGREPVHVTLRVRRDVPSLRTRAMYRAIREATIGAAKRTDFRIVHASVQRDHIHLIIEAAGACELSRGMQGFQISAARRLNAAISRRGAVFADRFHAHALRTPREVRHALAYVLNNWRKHGEDRGHAWLVDPFSTGSRFPGWHERRDAHILLREPRTYEAMFVWLPKTWLLASGWRKHPLISLYEVPGAWAPYPSSKTASRQL